MDRQRRGRKFNISNISFQIKKLVEKERERENIKSKRTY